MPDTRRNPDDYPEDPNDHEAWLATPPPPELGPALDAILAEVRSWTAQQRAERRAPNEATAEFLDAADRATDAIDAHPIGESPGCQEIYSVEPWLCPLRLAVNPSVEAAVMAVAARDHHLISAEDFATLTGWWASNGLPMPDPIGDANRARLIEWWAELGVLRTPSIR